MDRVRHCTPSPHIVHYWVQHIMQYFSEIFSKSRKLKSQLPTSPELNLKHFFSKTNWSNIMTIKLKLNLQLLEHMHKAIIRHCRCFILHKVLFNSAYEFISAKFVNRNEAYNYIKQIPNGGHVTIAKIYYRVSHWVYQTK